jgi:hypothetical protein
MRGYGQFCPVALGAEVFAEQLRPDNLDAGLLMRTFSAGQTFLELGPKDVNLTRDEAAPTC